MATETICDICGKRNCELFPIHERYKVDGVYEMCEECEESLNKHLLQIDEKQREERTRIMKSLITTKRRIYNENTL